MAVTDWKAAGTCADLADVGTIAWLAAGGGALVGTECAADNDVYACNTPTSASTTHYLKTTNFGFGTGDIPTGSTINGVEIRYTRRRDGGFNVTITTVKLIRNTTVSTGSSTDAVDWTNGSEEAKVYGSSTFVGSFTDLTDSDVRASNFGAVMSVLSNSGRTGSSEALKVDMVEMRVYYTAPATAKQPQGLGIGLRLGL